MESVRQNLLAFVAFLVAVESRSLKTKTTQHIQVNFSPNLENVKGRGTGMNGTLNKCPPRIDMTFKLNDHLMELHLQWKRKLDPHLLPVIISHANDTNLRGPPSNVSHFLCQAL